MYLYIHTCAYACPTDILMHILHSTLWMSRTGFPTQLPIGVLLRGVGRLPMHVLYILPTQLPTGVDRFPMHISYMVSTLSPVTQQPMAMLHSTVWRCYTAAYGHVTQYRMHMHMYMYTYICICRGHVEEHVGEACRGHE